MKKMKVLALSMAFMMLVGVTSFAAAPSVTADDINDTIIGIDATMEFSTDNITYTAYTGSNLPDLSGDLTIYVRLIDEGVGSPSAPTTLTFTATATGGGGSMPALEALTGTVDTVIGVMNAGVTGLIANPIIAFVFGGSVLGVGLKVFGKGKKIAKVH